MWDIVWVASQGHISVSVSAISFCRHHSVPVPCENSSAETTVAEGGRNPVAGLWSQTLGKNWPPEPTDFAWPLNHISMEHRCFSCGPQEVLLILPPCDHPVLKFTSWHTSRQHCRIGARIGALGEQVNTDPWDFAPDALYATTLPINTLLATAPEYTGTVFARNRDTAVPAKGNGDLQTLICVLVARPRRCPTLSNPVPWQNWLAAYLGYTLQMKTLFHAWPVMVHDTHTRRRSPVA